MFSKIMTKDKYYFIMRILHFSNDHLPKPDDKLYKIRMVIDSLKSNFGNNFVPSENLCIYESFLLFKGRLGFRQYIPSKRSRFGIKLFIICDSATGYVLDFIICIGVSTEVTNRNAPNMGQVKSY